MLEDILTGFLPELFSAVVFGVIVFTLIAAVRAKNKAQQQRGNATAAHPDKRQVAEKTTTAQHKAERHGHTGDRIENYGKIVGSLGEVSDEGCSELDGIRLISDDRTTVEETKPLIDRSDAARAIVLGEILGAPRCKRPYGRK